MRSVLFLRYPPGQNSRFMHYTVAKPCRQVAVTADQEFNTKDNKECYVLRTYVTCAGNLVHEPPVRVQVRRGTAHHFQQQKPNTRMTLKACNLSHISTGPPCKRATRRQKRSTAHHKFPEISTAYNSRHEHVSCSRWKKARRRKKYIYIVPQITISNSTFKKTRAKPDTTLMYLFTKISFPTTVP